MPRPVFKLEPPHVPYFLPEAVAYIETLIDEDSDVFEYGAGASTVWFAKRAKRVVTVEHDHEWAAEIDRALREAQVVSKVKMVEVEGEEQIAPAIENYAEFDMILVDCLDRRRTEAVTQAIEHVKPGGYLVIDDSQWQLSQTSVQIVEALGWQAEVFTGQFKRHDGQVKPHQTSVYQRPAGEDEEE